MLQQHLESVDMATMMSKWVVEEHIGEFIYLLYLCTTILSLSLSPNSGLRMVGG